MSTNFATHKKPSKEHNSSRGRDYARLDASMGFDVQQKSHETCNRLVDGDPAHVRSKREAGLYRKDSNLSGDEPSPSTVFFRLLRLMKLVIFPK
jgi:hypothetical protein